MIILLKSLTACRRICGVSIMQKFWFTSVASPHKNSITMADIDKMKLSRALTVNWRYMWKKRGIKGFMQKSLKKPLGSVDVQQLQDAISVLQSRNITIPDDVSPKIFLVKGHLLRKKISFLEEGGITADAGTIFKTPSIESRPIDMIKDCGYMRKDINVPKHILSQSKIEIDPPECSEDLSYETLHRIVLFHYIESYLNTTLSDSQRKLFQPFCAVRDVIQLFDIFENDLSLSHDFICGHLHLLNACPTHVRELLMILSQPYSFNCNGIVAEIPKLLLCFPTQVKNTIALLYKENFAVEEIASNPKVLIRHPFEVEMDLNFLRDVKSVTNIEKMRLLTCSRLQNKLSRLSLSEESMNAAAKKIALKLLTTKRKSLNTVLAKELGSSPSMIRSTLKLCPKYIGASVASVSIILHHLRSLNYSEEIIQENLHLLLYEWSYIQTIMDSYGINENSVPDSKIRLRLCMYHVLKEEGFSWWIPSVTETRRTRFKKTALAVM